MSAFRELTFDEFNAVESALAKARAIVEIVGKQITAELGFDGGAVYSDSLWAASDSLDQLASLLKLGKGEGAQ